MKITRVHSLPALANYDYLDSPVGVLTMVASPQGLHAVLWDNDDEKFIQKIQRNPNDKTILQTKRQLQEYFNGERKSFDLPIVMKGTRFQMQAWGELQKIPYGKTLTYGEQATKMGDKNKARAAGAANGLNPISIIIPCHRVIGAKGKLTGFRGGLQKKEFLLNLENSVYK